METRKMARKVSLLTAGLLLTIIIHLCGLTNAISEPNYNDPVLVKTERNRNGVPIFLGSLKEDEREVKLDPPLSATDPDKGRGGKICGYGIIGQHLHDVPFEIILLNNETGEAKIVVKAGETLNCEKREKYKFTIVAYDCGEIHHYSNKSIVIVHVEDVDEYPPTFNEDSYEVEVEEGHVFGSITQLTASDKDKSKNFSKICRYVILDNDVPFEISNDGVLKNTVPLDHAKRHNYMISVVAESCTRKRSKPVLVNILVKKKCEVGWKGIQQHLEYMPNSGRQKISEHAHLDLCDKPCQVEKVSIRMVLTTKHIGKGCDRDTYSISSQRKLCGANGDSVDLLPSPSVATWTSSLPTDDGKESDQIFAFDGQTNAVEVPDGHLNHSLTSHFTISTWMKREHNSKRFGGQSSPNKARKEHILCMSDGEHLNRHHYGLFVHGDKLVFLLRREAAEGEDMEAFSPAEWRWQLPQINDGEWHHYALSVDYPEVRLYIDGKVVVPSNHDFEVVDDWPLHRTKKVHFTELVVGACWQGSTKKFDHFFRGYLAELSVLRDKTESERVIKCLVNCKEYLDFHALNKMESGTSVSFNSEMTEFSIMGKNVTEVESLIREVSYVNARHYPTPGRRALKMETAVECQSVDGESSHTPLSGVSPVDVDIIVMHPMRPIITVQGLSNLTLTPSQLKVGRRVFSNVEIIVSQADDEDEEEDDEDDDDEDDDEDVRGEDGDDDKLNGVFPDAGLFKPQRKEFLLDSCTVTAEPILDLHKEVLLTPHNLIQNLKLESSLTNKRLLIKNADKVRDYITVLKEIRYVHKDGNSLGSRYFELVCSSQNGRFQSKPVKIKIMAIHDEEPDTKIHAHARHNMETPYSDNEIHMLDNIKATVSTAPNFGMAAIIVICVGFLLFMIILGVIRIRAAHKRTQVVAVDEKQEMEWDNSALNITVNPMDQPYDRGDSAMQALRVADSDSDDDDDDTCHDSSEEEAMEKGTAPTKVGRELEWDDSILSF
ncbi:calsyntenin-1 [Octopus sinensis]|uniref:Calsyntenin-1 n=1 Tax=Octopus sinensis TaxID=2607531 RepID=A0A6P7TN20_9MOLL|nr:calsyntenin-1 [Octopus sinensis]